MNWEFFFKKMNEDLRQEFFKLKFDVASDETMNAYSGEKEVPCHTYELLESRPDLVAGIYDYLKEWTLDHQITEAFCHYFEKGEEFYSHLDERSDFDYYVVVYLTETDDYNGREFLYRDGESDHLRIMKPRDGDIVYMNGAEGLNLWHGVSRMLSDTKVISIVLGFNR
jgi:hypothetical protein